MSRVRWGSLLVALCAGAGCTTIARTPPPPTALESAKSTEVLEAPHDPTTRPTASGRARPLARVGDRVVTTNDLLDHLLESPLDSTRGINLRQQTLNALNQLVVRHVIQIETGRHGMAMPADLVLQERAQANEDLALRALKAYGKGATAARFVELEYRMSLDRWLAIREAEIRESWLLQRLIRFDGIRADRVELQIILVDDEPLALELVAKLEAGADMSALAVKHSIHETAVRGGRMPPLARESLAPGVAERAFSLEPGQRTGALSVDDGTGRRQFEIVRLLRRIPARALPYAEASAEIEASLTAEPVSTLEFLAWNLRAERLYNIWIDATL